MLTQYHSVISLPRDPLGTTKLVKHDIPLKPGTTPIYIPAYRFPHFQRKQLNRIVRDMRLQGVFEERNSPLNFPLFLVSEKNGTSLPVVDHRQSHKHCQRERYPLLLFRTSWCPSAHKIGCSPNLTSGQDNGKCR